MKKVVISVSYCLLLFARTAHSQEYLAQRMDSLTNELKAGKINNDEFFKTWKKIVDSSYANIPGAQSYADAEKQQLMYDLGLKVEIEKCKKKCDEQEDALRIRTVLLVASLLFNIALFVILMKRKRSKMA